MTERSTEIKIEAAFVSDRGLNERRPLNEDSFLSDMEHNLFAVADGVGGAEAGEVASKTAVEVLEKAFKHQRDGDDVEDLMEIAIQRANASIFRMSREHPKFSMMATTIVALHLEGTRATVGHVGDSRLYSIGSDGSIRRETEDHSVVEEEVRAGRMTPEQALHHPSRNVISRAIGAESDVEVDLKTFEAARGTTFLLCTDGITRHLSDEELSAIIRGTPDLQSACDEMKRRCFERGAEDNLTAVLVRLNEAGASAHADDGDEQTIIAERPTQIPASASPTAAEQSPHLQRPFDDAGSSAQAPSSVSTSNGDAEERKSSPDADRSAPKVEKRRGAGRFFVWLFFLFLFASLGFYGGMSYERWRVRTIPEKWAATPTPTAQTIGTPATVTSDEERSKVDMSAQTEAERMTAELNAEPSRGDDAKFRYLYGRALLLSNKPQEALVQFERAVEIIRTAQTSASYRYRTDAYLATAAAYLRSNDVEKARAALEELLQAYPASGADAPASQQPTPQTSPAQPY